MTKFIIKKCLETISELSEIKSKELIIKNYRSTFKHENINLEINIEEDCIILYDTKKKFEYGIEIKEVESLEISKNIIAITLEFNRKIIIYL